MGEPIAGVGYLGGICGTDGTDWIQILVDENGKLRIVVDTNALPEGAATEETLAELSARVGDESSPASGTVNKQLADLLTELQQKLETADLASDTTRYINVLQQQYTGAAWVKSNLLFGYNDRYYESDSATSSAGNNTLSLTAVPSGVVRVIQQVAVVHYDSVARTMDVYWSETGGGSCVVAVHTSATAQVWYPSTVESVLKEADNVNAIFRAMNADKTIILRAWGYDMDIDM